MNNLDVYLLNNFIQYLNWNDMLNFRSINHTFKDIYHKWFWDKKEDDICIPNTRMISMTICDSCDNTFQNELNQKMLFWYEIPRPIYIYCNNVDCIHNVYYSIFKECIEKNIKIVTSDFLKLNEKKLIRIPRSNNEITYAHPNQKYVLQKYNSYYIYVQWDEYCKTVDINNSIICPYIKHKPVLLEL
tara:strand:- start:30 stop:590 length:561 start_codon:yes stop_codon:yes gene_type:complete